MLRAVSNECSRGLACGIVAFLPALASTANAAVVVPSPATINARFELMASKTGTVEVVERGDGAFLALVAIGDEVDLLHAWSSDVRADSYRVLAEDTPGTLREIDPGPTTTFRGTLLGRPGSVVAGGWTEHGLVAGIWDANGTRTWLEPLLSRIPNAPRNSYVSYHDDEVSAHDGVCAASEALRVEPPQVARGGDVPAAPGTLTLAELACDADYEYYQQWGSVQAVQNRIDAIIAAMNVQYERDVSITHLISAIIVRTAEPDPYTSTNPQTLLHQFRDHWIANHGGIKRDVAQLFTGRDLDGATIGIAWLSAVCSNLSFGVVQSDFNGTFSCATDLSAHELGHNWGADHCTCASNTMNPSITCANSFHPTSTIPEIVAFRNSRTCLSGGTPPDETIYIDDAFEFQAIGSSPAYPPDGHYVVVNDIDMGPIATFDPIGEDDSSYFRGVLNGQGHRIYGLHIDRPDDVRVGLFSVLMSSAEVRDLILEDVSVEGRLTVGALAGENGGRIINCHLRGTGSGGNDTYIRSSGVGVNGEVGGLVGENLSLLQGCSATGLVSVRSFDDVAGGLVGTNNTDGLLIWCWTASSDEQVRAIDHVAGGLVGTNQGLVVQCGSAMLQAAADVWAGGIAGTSSGMIASSYSLTPAQGNNGNGGLVGNNSGGTIEESYAAASVSPTSGCEGGLVGETDGAVSNCRWDSRVTGQSECSSCDPCGECCYGLPTSEMMMLATYTATPCAPWDFGDTWWMIEGVTYPNLCGVGESLPAPAALSASNDLPTGVMLQWDAIADDAQCSPLYVVLRAGTPDAPKTAVSGWQTETEFIDVDAIPLVEYFYWVEAAMATFDSPEFGLLVARESGLSDVAAGSREAPCPGDLDSSGDVGFSDILAVIAAWGPCAGACPEDLSGNGLVDFADVLELLGAWGPCP